MRKSLLLLATTVALYASSGGAQAQMSKVETVEYYDDPNEWVLGQVSRTTTNGVETSSATFGWKALPTQLVVFGSPVQTIGYDSTSSVASGQLGTIRTVADGKQQTSTFTDWYRGIPRSAAFPDGQSQAATVNAHGWILTLVNETGAVTTFGYDVMGRPSLIQYPINDTVAWADTTEVFEPINVAEYGIPAGHWRKTTSTGNARKVTYFDALWRPLLVHDYDASNMTTRRAVSTEYDASGRVVFQSYPSADTIPAALGTWTTYDALGRPTQVSQNNGAGFITTHTYYDANFVTRTVNPRGYTSETRYQAYEQPVTEFPVRIETAKNQPEASITLIQRDAFGKPLAITRRNVAGTEQLSRYYAYHPDQTLCRSSEPETGTTLYRYDAAGNLIRTDFAIPTYAPPVCQPSDSEPVVVYDPPPIGGPGTGGNQPPMGAPFAERTYDTRNRIKTLTFSSGPGNAAYTYEPDGLPKTIVTDNGQGNIVTTTYGYNKRRLITSEQMQLGSTSLSIGYGYSTLGHLAAQTVPGLTVAYAPNALGQATQAGPYATGVTYFPNGAVKQFTYGNGIVHTMTQNARQLPASSLDVGGGTALDLTYSYDANGNVTNIVDGAVTSKDRAMTYDAQDRLLTAVSPMFGGTDNTARYTYNSLDNLLTSQVNGRSYGYVYDFNNRLTNITQGTGGASIIGLQYDNAGNLSNKNGRTYSFDKGNRLRTVAALGPLPESTYVYDGMGRRVRDSGGGDKVSLYSQAGQLVYDDNLRVAQKTQYVYLAGSLVARVRNSTAPVTPVLTVPGTSTTGNYAVSWTSVSGATSYQVQERGASGIWADVYSGAGSTVAITGKASGTTFSYQVRACLNQGCSNWSGASQINVLYLPAGTPTLTAPATAPSGNYTVGWTTVSGATSYTLEERLGAGSWAVAYTGANLSSAFAGKAAGLYGYQVKACNAAGCAAYSSIATVESIYTPVDAPTLTAPATNTTGSYTVSWTSVGSATSYQLEEQANGGAWTQIHNAAGTSKAISGKATGNYGYRVRGCNAVGCGNFSSTATTAVTLPPAAAPTVTAPSTNNTGTFTVSWTAVAGATSYTLEESINAGTWTARYTGAALSFAITGRSTGSHAYRARACNGAGCGANSATATTQVTLPPTGVPTLTVPATSSTGSYTVSWTAVAAATSYTLQESQSGGAWTTVYSGAATSFALTGRGAGTHAYRVAACNAGGCAANSTAGSITVSLIPPTPTGLTGQGDVIPDTRPPQLEWYVFWNASPGATYYELQVQVNTQTPTVINMAGNLNWMTSGRGSRTFWVRACNASGCSAWAGPLAL